VGGAESNGRPPVAAAGGAGGKKIVDMMLDEDQDQIMNHNNGQVINDHGVGDVLGGGHSTKGKSEEASSDSVKKAGFASTTASTADVGAADVALNNGDVEMESENEEDEISAPVGVMPTPKVKRTDFVVLGNVVREYLEF
jgi:hypothetical protein